MKRRVLIILVLSCCIQYAHTQNIDKKEFIVDAAYRYTPLNPSFYKLLDTLSNSLQGCVFNMLERDYYFYIHIFKDNKISGQIFLYGQYPDNVILEAYRETRKANKGFFYYNEKLVLVRFVGQWFQLDMEKFCSRHYCLEAAVYSISTERLPEEMMAREVPSVDGFYDPITGNLTISKLDGCRGTLHYHYIVKEGDTWEILAEKFATTVENIRILNGKYDERDVPEKGHPIMVYYRIVDGVLEARREATRFDW